MKKFVGDFDAHDERVKRKWWIPILITVVILIIGIIAALIIIRPVWFTDIIPVPKSVEVNEVVVPWNPGGTADLVTRTLLNEAIPDMSIRNVHGASGTKGTNEVYAAPHDGKTMLGTNLSALITSRLFGFTETSHEDWEIWIVAYAPSIIAVSVDSPYYTLSDLIAAAQADDLRCANAGNGTLGFIAAHLFAEAANIEVVHVPYSGSNPAINAVGAGEADFIVALSAELIEKLRLGELRALASLSDSEIILSGIEGNVPTATVEVPALTSITPFGESYGVMLPKGTSSGILNSYDKQWHEAVMSDSFTVFSENKGILPLEVSRERSMKTTAFFASLACWALYDTGCVNVSPESIGINR